MKKKITIDGMHCAGCAASVEKAIKRVKGVQNVSVQLTTETADIEYEGNYPQQEIKQAVEKAGYELAENQRSGEISFDIEGMHCAGCSASVEKAAMRTEGVTSANVNLAAGKAYIEYDSGRVTPEEIAQRIDDAGYTVVRQKKKITS
jgi:Cu+-exporting ATPase